jgi:sialate O-acetylesterase
MKKYYLLLVGMLCICSCLEAKIILPKIFANNMVLQRNALIPIWGLANAKEKVVVRFNGQIKSIKTGKDGKWMVKLQAELAGGPYELSITGDNEIRITNVLVGEVWLCSGQSNMERTVAHSSNAKMEIATANYPFIRHFKMIHTLSTLPEVDQIPEEWKACDSTTVASFSGTAYFFAKRLYDSLKIPIGLINNSWGGTNIETWISNRGFESSDEFKEMIATVPKIDLDSLSRVKVAESILKIEALQGGLLNEAKTSVFKDVLFDDSKWPLLNEQQMWDQKSIGKFNFIVWLRNTIILTSNEAKNKATLELSEIDDDNITYVNGIKVGNSYKWDMYRKYFIPDGLLKEGENIIAVRVVDNKAGGGIYSDVVNLKFKKGETIVPINSEWKFQVASVNVPPNMNMLPSLCYNSMIAPLIPFAFKGVLWCQGEANTSRAYQYQKAFPILIKDWRESWKNPEMPFYFVQLSSYKTAGNSNEGCAWAELREAQSMALTLPNTGICVTTDIGEPSNIHPPNKQDVGKRLAALALNNLYEKKMICNGPVYKSLVIKDNKMILSFDNIGSGLFTPDKYGYIRGFEIAGKDQVFYFAKATIIENTVQLLSNDVANPIAVHYAWAGDASECNLFNKEGFPAMPFRTDNWKNSTKIEKYKIDALQ